MDRTQGVLIKPTQKLADSLLIRSALHWWVGGRNDRLVADFISAWFLKSYTHWAKNTSQLIPSHTTIH